MTLDSSSKGNSVVLPLFWWERGLAFLQFSVVNELSINIGIYTIESGSFSFHHHYFESAKYFSRIAYI